MAGGLYSRLTADDIALVRDIYRRLESVRKERRDLMGRLRLTREYWRRIGIGRAGKKPRRIA